MSDSGSATGPEEAGDPATGLRAWVDAAFSAEGRPGSDRRLAWRIAGSTWIFSMGSEAAERWITTALRPGVRAVDRDDELGDFSVRLLDDPEARLAPPAYFGSGDTTDATQQADEAVEAGRSGKVVEAVRRIWIAPGLRVGHQVTDDILTVVDLDNRRGLVRTRDASALKSYERAAPMRHLLHWGLSAAGLGLVHAAAVGTGRGAVLLVGRGGTGKSSTALAALAGGMRFAGDDYVLVDPGRSEGRLAPDGALGAGGPLGGGGKDGAPGPPDDPSGAESDVPRVFGLFATAKVHARDLDRYAGIDARLLEADPTPDEKAVLLLGGPLPGFTEGMPLRAIVIPQISTGPLRMRRCPSAHALRALAPSTLLQAGGDRERLFETCSALARRLPAYVLETGPRSGDYPQAIAGTLAGLVDSLASP